MLDRCEIARFDQEAWDLFYDLDVLRQLEAQHARGPRSRPRRPAALRAQPLLQRLVGRRPGDLGRGARGARRPLREQERQLRARRLGDRPRAHRHGLALADRGDLPQVRAHVQLADGVHGRLPRVPLRLLAGPAVRLGQGAQPRPLPPHPGAGRARPVHPGRRQLDRARLQHPVRRVARAPVPARPVVLRARVRPPLPRVLEPRRLRLQRPAAADHARRRHRPLPHAEAVVERVQQARVPHVPLAGDRRQRGAHALPAGRHLQRPGRRRRDPPQRARLQGSRPLELELPALRLRRRRRRPDARHARDAAPRRRPAGRAAHAPSARATSSSTELERSSPDLPVLVGELYFEYHRGTYTSQAEVKRANRKCELLLHDVELLAAVAHWRGLQRVPAGRARASLGDALPEPVPRHHPRLVDQRGVRGRAPRLRRDRARGRGAARLGARCARGWLGRAASAQHPRDRAARRGRGARRRVDPRVRGPVRHGERPASRSPRSRSHRSRTAGASRTRT